MPFLFWHFSPGDKIENRSAQFLAVRDAPQFSIRQFGPAFQQGNKNLIPVLSRCRFDRHVTGLILFMNFERLAKYHFG